MSREKILALISQNQPDLVALPVIQDFAIEEINPIEKFTNVAVSIGAKVFEADSIEEIKEIIQKEGRATGRIVSVLPEFADIADPVDLKNTDPHTLKNVDLAILNAELAVAENSASWITASNSAQRVLPFICEHLVLIVQKGSIVPTMQQAYERIGDIEYEYSTFIAGPSKTADIEQSLVLGAHGPRSLTIFIIPEESSENYM